MCFMSFMSLVWRRLMVFVIQIYLNVTWSQRLIRLRNIEIIIGTTCQRLRRLNKSRFDRTVVKSTVIHRSSVLLRRRLLLCFFVWIRSIIFLESLRRIMNHLYNSRLINFRYIRQFLYYLSLSLLICMKRFKHHFGLLLTLE